jgi:hypothetical protein
MVAIAKPQDIHGLRLVVDAKSGPECTEMRFDGTDTKSQTSRCVEMGPFSHVSVKNVELTLRRPKHLPAAPSAPHGST